MNKPEMFLKSKGGDKVYHVTTLGTTPLQIDEVELSEEELHQLNSVGVVKKNWAGDL